MMKAELDISPLQHEAIIEHVLNALVECAASDEISQETIDGLYETALILGVTRDEIESELGR